MGTTRTSLLESLTARLDGRLANNYHTYGWSSAPVPWKLWKACHEDGELGVFVEVESDPFSIAPFLARTKLVDDAYLQLRGVVTVDVRFDLKFAHRSDAVASVYGSAQLLQNSCGYFRSLFNGGFAESTQVPLKQHPLVSWDDPYDYDSDSDLDACSEFDEADSGDGVDDSRPSDSTGVSRSGAQEHISTTPSNKDEGSSAVSKRPSNDTQHIYDKACPLLGRVITIKGVAYVTFKALIFYLYSKTIEFAPLTSRNLSRRRTLEQRETNAPCRASPKSIYRLADKLGLTELRELAMNEINAQLLKENVLDELFSSFTADYEAIREIQIECALKHWDDLEGGRRLEKLISEKGWRATRMVFALMSRLQSPEAAAVESQKERPTTSEATP